MNQLIKKFRDGSYLEYDQGKFDPWCVYMVSGDGCRNAPRDIDYFTQIKSFAETYGAAKLYGDYVQVYNITTGEIREKDLDTITNIAKGYGTDGLGIDKVLSILYMAMIAEENKENTKLGKRIKRLGIHRLLIEGASAEEAANFMKGMQWRVIDGLCRERGF